MDKKLGLEYKDKEYRIWEQWEILKENSKIYEEELISLEDEALKEIYEAKDIVPINGKRVSEIISNDETIESEDIRYLIEKIGYMSIYRRHLMQDGADDNIYFEANVDNVSLFKSLLVINLLAIMNYITTKHSEQIGIKVIFEKKEYRDDLEDKIDEMFRKVLKGVKPIKFEVKKED